MSLLPVQSVLGVVDDLLDLVLSVVDLLLGLTRTPIRLAFGLKVLVAGKDARGLLDVTLDLIRECLVRVPSGAGGRLGRLPLPPLVPPS
jgi:hypothetical protein